MNVLPACRSLLLPVLLGSCLLGACNRETTNAPAMQSDEQSNEQSNEPSHGTDTALPVAKIENVADTHWGVTVNDPYRYMEDVDDPYVLDWFKAQAAYASDYLAAVPERDQIFARLRELDQGAPFSTYSIKELTNGDVFYLRREAGESLPKLFVHARGKPEPRLLLDPESLRVDDEAHASIQNYQPSWDGTHLVYGLAQGGSEETVFYVMDVATGNVVDTPITNIETAYNRPQWALSGEGFYYSRRRDLPAEAPVTEIYKQTAVRYHRLGTDPANDPVVAGFGTSDRLPLLDTDFPSLVITPGSDEAVLQVKHGDNNEISLFTAPRSSLLSGDVPWLQISAEADEVIDFAVVENEIYLLSAKDAPRAKLLKTSLLEPSIASAASVIAPGDTVLSGVAAAADAVYVNAKQDGIGIVLRITAEGDVQKLAPPRGGAAYLGAVSPLLPGVRIFESSWIQGGIRYIYDPTTGEFADDGLVPPSEFGALEGYVAKELTVPSHDGVLVPVSIIHRADLKMDGSHPTIVYGYGSYGISINVGFSPIRMAWLERGGVYAIAHVRGGGEYGPEWHQSGRMQSKPNTWLDLIATTQYLIDEGYTSPEHVAPMGGSAGGILVGRSITTRPDLFGAAVIQVGMLDAIRAETTTNGVPNIKEFGTVTDKEGFAGLLAMSAYHAVDDDVTYPATLLTHGFNDPRVNPWMSGKMAARLQAVNGGDPTVLMRVDFDAGHGIGSTREQVLAQYADIYAFLWQELR